MAASRRECIQRSKENLAAASEPKKEKYKGNDNAPVIAKITLLAAKQERQPANAILDFPPINAALGRGKQEWLLGLRTLEIGSPRENAICMKRKKKSKFKLKVLGESKESLYAINNSEHFAEKLSFLAQSSQSRGPVWL